VTDPEAVRAELDDIDARLAGLRSRATTSVGYRYVLGGWATAVVAFVLVLLAVVSLLGSAQDGDLATGAVVAAVFAVLAAGLTVITVRLFRRAYRGLPAVAAERRALIERRAALLAGLDPRGARPGQAASAGPPGAGPAGIRRPGPWAIAMHARFPLGPSPVEAVRRLPPDAPAWKVWLAGSVGWGAAAAVLLVLATIVVGTALAVLLTR
jgi:hypothetical protein